MPETTRQQTMQGADAYRSSQQRYLQPDMPAGEAALACFKDYARERPEIVTMWAFGIGFVLGWKLRIW